MRLEMVKTTVTLEDHLYRKLVKESLEKYGRTRSLSRLINERLKETEGSSHTLNEEKRKRIIENVFGSWKTKESGAQYAKKLRLESEKRFRRLGI